MKNEKIVLINIGEWDGSTQCIRYRREREREREKRYRREREREREKRYRREKRELEAQGINSFG